MTPEEQKKALRKLKAEITRRKNHKGNPTVYVCSGGPFDGAEIAIRTTSTMIFTVDQQSGHYRHSAQRGYYHQERRWQQSIAVWVQS